MLHARSTSDRATSHTSALECYHDNHHLRKTRWFSDHWWKKVFLTLHVTDSTMRANSNLINESIRRECCARNNENHSNHGNVCGNHGNVTKYDSYSSNESSLPESPSINSAEELFYRLELNNINSDPLAAYNQYHSKVKNRRLSIDNGNHQKEPKTSNGNHIGTLDKEISNFSSEGQDENVNPTNDDCIRRDIERRISQNSNHSEASDRVSEEDLGIISVNHIQTTDQETLTDTGIAASIEDDTLVNDLQEIELEDLYNTVNIVDDDLFYQTPFKFERNLGRIRTGSIHQYLNISTIVETEVSCRNESCTQWDTSPF